jgi:hypothetical protein
MTDAWRPDDQGEDELERLFAEQREAWRGGVHLADWPEASAGPEYWMYKRAAEGA